MSSLSRACVYLALGMAVISSASAEVVDRVLAVVDREPILMSDLMDDIAREMEYISQTPGAPGAPSVDDLVGPALDEAINRKILLREAQLNAAMYPALNVSDDQVETQIESIRSGYDNNEQFMRDLEKSGENLNDIRERVRKNIMQATMGRLKRQQFRERVVISESEIAQYYQDNIGEYQRPERVRLRQIFIEGGESEASRAKARAQLEQLAAELDAGADFQELAKQYSDAIGAEDGGIIGWTNRGDLVPALDEAAFNLGEGQRSGIVETDGGFHILLAESREDAGLAGLDEVRTEIQPILRDQAANVMYQDWLTEQRKRSRVQIFR